MKKQVRMILTAAALVLSAALPGCASGGKEAPASTAPSAATPAPSAESTGTTAQTGVTVEDAKKTALDHAGVSEKDAVFLKESLDMDDGTLVYEIKFASGMMEYEYKIDANTGAVVSYEKEAENPAAPTAEKTPATPASLTEQDALDIALKHAGVDSASVTSSGVEKDFENGHSVYEVKFTVGASRMEYEYDIDADSGEILKYESEKDD